MAKKPAIRFNKGTPAHRVSAMLDDGYRHGYRDIFRWMVATGLERFGLPTHENVPEDARPLVEKALNEYRSAVADSEFAHDVLGDVYMSLVSLWGQKVLGQYFTPSCVSEMMASITLGDLQNIPERKPGQLITVLEPCVGAGGMLLAAMRVIARERGIADLKQWSFTGVDLDTMCARMWALQALMNCHVHEVEFGELVSMAGSSLGDPKDWEVILHATHAEAAYVPALHPAKVASIQEAVGARKSSAAAIPSHARLQEADPLRALA